MQADHAGHDGVSGEVEDFGAFRDGHIARRACGGDAIAFDDDGLVAQDRPAGAVDQCDALQRDGVGIDGYVRGGFGALDGALGVDGRYSQQERAEACKAPRSNLERESSHRVSSSGRPFVSAGRVGYRPPARTLLWPMHGARASGPWSRG